MNKSFQGLEQHECEYMTEFNC